MQVEARSKESSRAIKLMGLPSVTDTACAWGTPPTCTVLGSVHELQINKTGQVGIESCIPLNTYQIVSLVAYAYIYIPLKYQQK